MEKAQAETWYLILGFYEKNVGFYDVNIMEKTYKLYHSVRTKFYTSVFHLYLKYLRLQYQV